MARALDDGALDDGALDDGALDDGALDDGALDDGALDCRMVDSELSTGNGRWEMLDGKCSHCIKGSGPKVPRHGSGKAECEPDRSTLPVCEDRKRKRQRRQARWIGTLGRYLRDLVDLEHVILHPRTDRHAHSNDHAIARLCQFVGKQG
jgi:hypothetical protein